MDTLEFRVSLSPEDPRPKYISVHLAINDIDSGHASDPMMVIKMLNAKAGNRVFFWTCSCGDPSCSDIRPCLIESSDELEIKVHIPYPIGENLIFPVGEGYFKHTFNTRQVKQAFRDLVINLRAIDQDALGYACGYYASTREELKELFDLPTMIEARLNELEMKQDDRVQQAV
jgi:hypothetical protein